MPWSNPLPPADVAAIAGLHALLQPIAILALLSVALGFAVLVAGMFQEAGQRRSRARATEALPVMPASYAKASRPA